MKHWWIYIVLYSLSFFSTLKAQNQEDGLVSLATEMYEFGDKREAQGVFLKALEYNQDNAKANLMVGVCYLETIHKNRALPFVEKAYQLDSNIREDILLLIGDACHYAYNFDKAIEFYEHYMIKYADSANLVKLIDKKILECNFGKEFVARPVDVAIHNLGMVNSSGPDYAPVISADESVLIFTSRREGNRGLHKDIDNLHYEDIYICYKENQRWSKPVNIGSPINTKYHDACVGLSADGKRLYIYKDNEFGTGGIFFCDQKENKKWTRPKPITAINTEYIESSANLSADFKTLYFSSNRPEGYGGLDIYMCKRDEKFNWSKPINLGPVINTEYDEDNPFPDIIGNTLYFSSTGHNGMGNYDIFKTNFINEDEGWTEPENLGYPINSPDNDIHFVLSGDGRFGYYSSIKEYGFGDNDLYIMKMPERSYEDEVLINLAAVTGKSIDELKDNQTDKDNLFDYSAKIDEKIRVKQDLIERMGTYNENNSGLPLVLLEALEGISFNTSPLFIEADLNNDKCITTDEIYAMIDVFFMGETNYSVKQIYRLIDFYFGQEC